MPNYAMDAQVDALTLKKGSLSASIKALDAFLIVRVLTRRPIAHTAMHRTAGSSTCLESLVGPDLRKCLSSASRQG